MNVLNFQSKSDCERVQGLLFAYLSNQLLIETNEEIHRHLETCDACKDELEQRRRMQSSLKRAFASEPVPAALVESLRRNLRSGYSSTAWLLAAAAAIVLGLGGYFTLRLIANNRTFTPDPALASVLKVGLDDHIHCATGTWYRGKQFTDEAMTQRVGPAFAGLVPIVKAASPHELRAVVGHQCEVNGRSFVHFILQGDDKTVSFIVTRKNGETLDSLPGGTKLASDVTIHSARMQDFEVAGYETAGYLVYFVSDMSRLENQKVAAALASPVRNYLNQNSAG